MLNRVSIKSFAKVSSGQGAPQKASDFSDEGFPFIRAGNIEDLLSGRDELSLPKINIDIANKYKLKLFQPNTIVFAKSGMSALKGRIYKVKTPCYIVNHLATLELSNEVSPDYILFTLRHFSPVRLIVNSAYPSLNLSAIEDYEIPLPDLLDDQKRIAKILMQCEEIIQKRKKSIQLLDDLLKSKFIEMFGAPETNPYGWEDKVFGDFTEYIGDIGSNGSNDTVSKNLVMSDNEDYAIMIRTTNLNANDFTKNLKYISKETYDFFSKSKIYGGEIIMNKIGSPGKFWIMPNLGRPVSLGLNQFVIRLKDLNTNYIKYFLSTNFGEVNIQSRTQGATTKSITKSAVRSLPVLYPPMELQIEFSELVDKVEGVKYKFNESLKELENLYGSISQRAFNGELHLSKVDISDMEDSKKKDIEEVKVDLTEEQFEDLLDSFEHTLPTGEVPSNRETDIRNMSIRQYLRLPDDEAAEGFEFSKMDKDYFYQFILTKGFPEGTFTLPDLEQYARKYILRGTGFEFTYDNWKTILFRFIGAEQPIIEQVFDDETKTIKLKLTDEAFKV